MSETAQRALQVLVAGLERHLAAVDAARSGDDAAVDEAYDALAAAFERYEEALDLEYAEDLPFVLDDSSDDLDDEDDDDEFDGLAGEDIEEFDLDS